MKRTLIFLLTACCFLSAPAQKKQQAAVKAKKPVNTEAHAAVSQLYKTMLPSTAKVMFIDSVVVNKDDFLSHVPLNHESGTISLTNPKADFANQMACYQNEIGDRRVKAIGDSSKTALYTQTLLGDQWSKSAKITDFAPSTYTLQNYPFLAADGVTLYFSAGGSESMGGRDVFISSFDSDEANWYKPQNCGLPFNSTANDYLLAIDDLDTLGWLVTDRRQPAGKVCIYTFVPTEARLNFDDDDISENELKSYADIRSIKATWKFGNRNAAMRRYRNMQNRIGQSASDTGGMRFVVNDRTIITSPSQFKKAESRKLYNQVAELQKMITQTTDDLSRARMAYHNGNHRVAEAILKAETDLDDQQRDLEALEKKIRSLEN